MGVVEIIESNFGLVFIVNRMEFNKLRWSYPWNSDQNCIQNSARGLWGYKIGRPIYVST